MSIYVDFKRGNVHFQKKDTILKKVADSQKIRQARFRLYAEMRHRSSVEIVQPAQKQPQIEETKGEQQQIDRLLKNALGGYPRSEQRVKQLLDTIDDYTPEERLISAAIIHSKDKFLEILNKHPVKDPIESQEAAKVNVEFYEELLFTAFNPELPKPETCTMTALSQKVAEIEKQLKLEVLELASKHPQANAEEKEAIERRVYAAMTQLPSADEQDIEEKKRLQSKWANLTNFLSEAISYKEFEVITG